MFSGELVLKYLNESVDGKWFRTVKPFTYHSTEYGLFEIPSGINTDFASIPRGFLWIIDSIGKYGRAAVLHDWLCEYKVVNRKTSDKIFLEAMRSLKVGWLKRNVMYFGVRAYSIGTFKR